MSKKVPKLDAACAKVKIEPYLNIKSGKRNITIQETAPVKLIRISLNAKNFCRYVEIKNEAEFEAFWNKLLELSIPCY